MSKIKLIFQIGHGIVETQARIGSRLVNVMRKEGLANSEFYECNYKLECAKCTVYNEIGTLGYPSIEEEKLLASKGYYNNVRCACQVIIDEKMDNNVVRIPYNP
jgi:ferredoxin